MLITLLENAPRIVNATNIGNISLYDPTWDFGAF